MSAADEKKLFSEVEEILPEIQRIAKGCAPEFQVACFKTLLNSWLSSHFINGVDPTTGDDRSDKVSFDLGKPGLSQFIKSHELSVEKFRKSIDIKSGRIIAGKINSSKMSDRQRTIAALLALSHLVSDGSLTVPKNELKELCKKYAADDPKHINENINELEIGGSLVFTSEANGWSVTVPGEDYLVSVIENYSIGSGEKSG